MTKNTVHLNSLARKSGFRLQFLRQSPLLERSDDLPMIIAQCSSLAKLSVKQILVHSIQLRKSPISPIHDQFNCQFRVLTITLRNIIYRVWSFLDTSQEKKRF